MRWLVVDGRVRRQVMEIRYHGPGTYDSSSDPNEGGGIYLGNDGQNIAAGPDYNIGDNSNGNLAPPTSWTMVVRPDGSGTFTFVGAYALIDGQPNGKVISGSVIRTCQNVPNSS